MEWWQALPSAVWELPLQLLVLVLISMGVFVTKREHANMTKMMEYFRTKVENKEETILNQAKTIEILNSELAPLLKQVLTGVRQIANEKRDNVSSQEEA